MVVSRLRHLLVVMTALATAWPINTFAQVEEIIVTARKREESLQEVPLSITAFDTQALRDRNIQSVFDLAAFTPNFSFNRNTVGRRLDAPNIRGQFNPLQNYGLEGNAGFFVDGVFVSGIASTLTVDNLERVEILRGPQSAQFGRSTFAGAVNYITRQASNEFDSEVYLKAGEERDYKTSAWASGPILRDKLLFMVSASWESFDGEWRNELRPCSQTPVPANCTDVTRAGTFPWTDASGQPLEQPVSGFKNDTTGIGGESAWNVTGKLTWQALDNLAINLKVDHSESDDEHFASLFAPELNCYDPRNPLDPKAAITRTDFDGQDTPRSPGWFCGEVVADGHRALMNIADLREGATSYYGTAAPAPFIGTQTETDRYLIEGILDLSGWTVVARWADNSQDLEQYRDLDRSPYLGPLFVNLFDAGEYQTFDDNSAELRVSTPVDQPVRATVGGYYYDAENKGYQREFTGFCGRTEYGKPLINGAPSWTLDKDARNLAGFGSVEADISPTWILAVEARYAQDTPEQHSANGISAKDTYRSFTPRVTLTWKPGADFRVYGLVAKGNKPGGFFYAFFDAPVTPEATLEGLANGRARIKEEEAWTYEFGAKTQWLDRRLTANASIYYIDWTNQAINQVENVDWTCLDPSGVYNTTPIANNFVANAGKSRVVGGEVELSMAVTENLSMSINYGLADTELDEFNSLVIDNLVKRDVLIAAGRYGNNASGNEAPNVPKHSVSAYTVYRRALGDRGAEWFTRADFIYQSKRWVDSENEAYIGEPKIVNGRIGVDNGTWTATIYADNMLDDDTPALASQFPNFSGFPFDIRSAFHIVPRRGRNYGLTLQYRFGRD